MPRIGQVILSVLLLLAGCTWDNPLRRNRDAALLSRDDPPRYELRSSDAGPPPPLVTDTLRVYGNPAENQDGGLELHAAMVEGLKNSRVVRVVDGTGVSAGPNARCHSSSKPGAKLSGGPALGQLHRF